MADMHTPLLPCPHCGGEKHAKVEHFQFPPDEEGEAWEWGYHVVCDASGLDTEPRGCGASSAWGETPADAIAAWNRRSPSHDAETVKALREQTAENARSAGQWEDAHRELLDAIMACCDPENKVCGLHPGPERIALEEVISRHHTVHRIDGPFVSAALAGSAS